MVKWPWQKKDLEEKALEPFSLAPNPMAKEAQLAGVISVPLLAFLIVILYLAKTMYMTQEEFALLTAFGFGCWIAMLVSVYGLSIQSANKHMLFDREFGFTERLHPRHEVFCLPEDVRLLLGPDDEIKNKKELEERLKKHGLQKLAEEFKDVEFKKYLYYFKHRHVFEGWDKDKHEVLEFQSHYVFQDKDFDDQYVFGAGQENWWGPILFNHPHAESDNVKVLGWGLDPFSNTPIPACLLIHSSKKYRVKKDGDEKGDDDFNTLDGMKMLNAHQHGIIDRQMKALNSLRALLKSKFDNIGDLLKIARDIADVDIELFSRILKPRKTGRFAQFGKIFLYGITVFGVILLIWMGLHYLFDVWMPLF